MLKHRCADSWLRAERMLLASLDRDEDALALIVAELGDCVHCWRHLAMHLVWTSANDRIMSAGGLSKAAESTAQGMARTWLGIAPEDDPDAAPDVAAPTDGATAGVGGSDINCRGLLRRILFRCRYPRKRQR